MTPQKRSFTARLLRATWSFATRLLLALLGLLLLTLGLGFARDFVEARPTHVIGWVMVVGAAMVAMVGAAALVAAISGRMPRWLRDMLDIVGEALPGGDGRDTDDIGGGGGFGGGGAAGRL